MKIVIHFNFHLLQSLPACSATRPRSELAIAPDGAPSSETPAREECPVSEHLPAAVACQPPPPGADPTSRMTAADGQSPAPSHSSPATATIEAIRRAPRLMTCDQALQLLETMIGPLWVDMWADWDMPPPGTAIPTIPPIRGQGASFPDPTRIPPAPQP